MKLKISVLLLVSLFLLTGCNSQTNEAYGYTLTREDIDACATVLEIVYTDDVYEYYFSCSESSRFVIENDSGDTFTIYEILEDDLLTIEELYDLFDGDLLRTKIDSSD